MGLGSTAKKLQKVANMAEDLYKRMNDLVSQMKELQSDVEETTEQVDDLERQVTEQRAIIEALAAQQGIDVDEVLAEVEGTTAEDDGNTSAETDGDASADESAEESEAAESSAS